jgi:HSP20 family protein
MSGIPSVFITPELGNLADDVSRVFRELDEAGGRSRSAALGQCTPALDVLETDETVELVVDLPGVEADAVRVVLKGGVVVVAGEKLPVPPGGSGDYHLLERGSGRFARAVRISTPFDGSRVTASLAAGELRVVLPKIHERRGRARAVALDGEPPRRE